MSWLAFLLSAFCVLIGFMAAGNLIVGLTVVFGHLRGNRCTEQGDFGAAVAMVIFGVPICSALSVLCWWASGWLAG